MERQTHRAVVLIVDDDRNTRDGLEKALRAKYDVHTAESGPHALEILNAHRVDLLLSDVRMPGMDGLVLLQRALAHVPGLLCILLTAYGSVETAVSAMKQGAYDFLMKPVNLDHLELLLERALRSRRMEAENLQLREQLNDKFGLESLVGNSPPMQEMFETIRQAAPTQATLLITGETGTGKELVAQAIHRLSPRAQGPFVAVHCAALAPSLLESELFGHEKGAFTGAMARRRGRFELADGGSLFLDEISEVDPSVQVKLLRVLEEQRFERVGGAETLDVDIRLITATNRDLKAFVAAGRFREDLYFRLDVVNIHIPPLRERTDDIPLLCDHFVKEFGLKNAKDVQGITAETCHLLTGYPWPGNVRELRNTIEKMVVLAHGPKLTPRDIPRNIREAARGTLEAPAGARRAATQGESLADAERRLIEAALQRTGGNVTRTAKELGISRRTMHRKLKNIQPAMAERATEPDETAPGG